MSRGIDLSSYVDVATRIQMFRERFPNGSLRPLNPEQPYRIETIGDCTFIVVVAAAYRDASDKAPGVGMAMEAFPGATPYTRGSELQNAETSAWGRAIVAVLAADTRYVASRDEVESRQADSEHREAARRNVIANATAAIEAAETTEDLDQVGKRITAVEKQGLISGADAVDLRRMLVLMHDKLKGNQE